MPPSPDHSSSADRHQAFKAMYDLTEDFDEMSADELNPSFASIEQEEERYDLVEEIATGGMKKIYRTYDRLTRRDVAMAVLRPDAPKEYFDPFIHEAWITAKLDHPNIIRIHDLGVNHEQRPFFTMDLKTGQSLQQLESRPSGFQPLESFSKICEAVGFAHSKGILHLDLKPDNIQMGQYGRVVVCDWGLAKFTEKNITLDSELGHWDLDNDSAGQTGTIHGQIKGTPGYMAPEQIRQDETQTVQTDIYGLGCILHFLTTREELFSGTHDEIMEKTLAGNLQLSRYLPKPLRAIIIKCTQQKSQDRYPSVDALLTDIRRYLNGYSSTAEETGFLKEVGLFYLRNRRLCLVIGVCLVALSLSAAFFIFHLIDARLLAEESESRAKKTLQLYEKEKQARNELDIDYSSSLQDMNSIRSYSYFYQKPDRALNEIIKTNNKMLLKNPGDDEVLHSQALTYAIKLDFASANETMSYISLPFQDNLMKLCNLYADDPRFSRKPPVQAVTDVIRSAREVGFSNARVVNKMLIYDSYTRKNRKGYHIVIKEVIHYYNPEWTDIEFLYNTESHHLKLGGKNLTTLAVFLRFEKRSFLSYIKLRSLDISDTEAFNLSHFQELRLLEHFNISGTLISTPPTEERFPRLKTLTISPDQFTPEQIKTLSTWVNVRVHD